MDSQFKTQMNAIKEAHYNLGIAYLEAGQYNRAVAEFEAAIKLDPNFIGAHCALCRAYLEQNELENAGAAVKAALKLDPNHQPAVLLYGTITEAYHHKGKEHLDGKHYTEAVAAFQKAITLAADLADNAQPLHAENTHIHVHLGAAYIGMKEYQKAIEALEQALLQDADLVDAHYNLGYAYVEQGTCDKAIPHLERAIAIAPHLKRAHYNLARAYRESGNLEAATNALTETLRLDANYQPAHELADTIKQAHYNRGITHYENERYSEAVTAFQNAITLDSDFAAAHHNLGLTYLKMEAYPRAILSLEKTTSLDPNPKAAYHALALAYLGQQELGKARDAARDALKIDANYQPALSLLEAIDPSFTPPLSPSTPAVPEVQAATPPEPAPEPSVDPQPDPKPMQETHYELGMAYLDANMHTEAIAEFHKTIDLDPDFAAAYVGLGTAYFQMGQLADAENAVKTALKIDADSEPARQLLDDIKQASRPFVKRSLQKNPTDVKQDLERAIVYLNNLQYNHAASAFKRVLKAEPNSVEAHYGLGQAYLEIGAFDDAKAAADAALRIDANHQRARELLQVIKFARNMERNKKLQKKILRYAVILGIIAAGVFAAYRFNLLSWPQQQPLNLSIPEVVLEGQRENFLEAGETAPLKLVIHNSGGTARNIAVKFEPATIPGVQFKKPDLISKIGKDSNTTLRISMTAYRTVKGRDVPLQIQVIGKREVLATKDFTFKIIPQIARRR